ncbi:alpha/beta fold hydrolase [Actinokineospora pegani]|uniref:alpha/beta fold hydrolase n=1 Tax=Actinokineospora pegani TaxID=2654637 RepID=UPI0012E9AE2F|nr:alpha/beta hydrolase [Actinokineospora pegani]
MSAGYLDAPWGQVHYHHAPGAPVTEQLRDGRPLLVLLHQSPLSGRRYRRALAGLAGFCVPVAVDTPGYGNSGPPGGQWSAADYGAVAWLVADAFGAERPWLFGRATGAVFALAAAAGQPGRAAGVVLHGLPVYTEAEKADRLAGFAPPYAPDDDGAHLAWIWARVRGEYPWADPALSTDLVADYLAAGPDFAASYRAVWRHDLAAAAERAGPVDLLLAGAADRIGHMHARAVAAVAHTRAAVLAGATDFVAEQDPAAFCGALADTIDRTGETA